ncbi:MAG TPA: hypothetical protein DCY79_20965 [Planctomycetaceae bacterium]|mgnify:CR=1 FL=1|nr:hypothetical protein [Blastopirellula sp.]HAY82285.1 hypothetical protein [Planctomycetaceae bacterium]
MVNLLLTCCVALLATVAELWHGLRIRRLSPLAFGAALKPQHARYAFTWSTVAGVLRVVSLTAICWGLLTLLSIDPKVHQRVSAEQDRNSHLVIVLDVSPSMRLQDAGPEKDQTRRKRTFAIMQSFFKRAGIGDYKVSVIGVYTGAKPVVVDTTDLEVVRNILNELPLEYAFTAGKTDIFAGLQTAADIARPWNPRSTVLLVLTDGDTVPPTGMPKMPASVAKVVVIGVGDPVKGQFIAGQQSRQDVSTLRQIAGRLQGTYHNGNENHIGTALIKEIAASQSNSTDERLTLRDLALLACGGGAATYALLPLILHFLGSLWNPGVPATRDRQRSTADRQPSTTQQASL